MAPQRILEIRITGCLFSDSNFYRLALDGHETELQTVSTTVPKFNKVLHVQLSEGNNSIELGVFGMVDGTERQMATASVPVNPGKDFVHHDLTIASGPGNTVTGIVKIAYKQIKLNVVYFLRETVSDKSVLGISVNTALIGEGAEASSEYKDVRIKVRDKEGTILGNNKVSNDKSAAFFPLEEGEVFSNETGMELFITLEEYDGATFTLPISFGAMSVCLPMSSTLALLLTVQLLYQPARLAGLVHEVNMAVLKESGNNDKVSAVKGGDYMTLLHKNLLLLQFINPASGEADVALPEDAITRGVHGAPFERSAVNAQPDGFFLVAAEAQNGRSSKKKALLKKNLILHMGTFGISPQLVADPSVLLQCKCFMVAVNTVILGDVDGSLSCDPRHNQLMGTGVLEEKEREMSRETGVISVVLEGAVAINNADEPLMKALAKTESFVSVRVTLSIVPTESPPLLSPTGELMPLSPPESPRLDDDDDPEHKSRAPNSNSVPKLDMSEAGMMGQKSSSSVVLKPEASAEQLGPAGPSANMAGELPGQWDMQDARGERRMYEGEDIENWGSPGGLGDNFSPSKYKIDRASTALVAMIKSELVEKQRLIDRLVGEASARTDAIELCGREIRTLREEAMVMQQKFKESVSALNERDQGIAEASHYVEELLGAPDQLNKLSRTTLLHVAADLGERLIVLQAEKKELEDLLAEAQAARRQFEEDKSALSELQEASVEQARLIQKLQKRLSATDALKATIKLQERVIAKMQAVVEAHLRTTRPAGGPEAAGLLNRLLEDLERQGHEEELSLAQAHQEEQERGRRKLAEEELKREKAETEKLRRQIKQLEFDLDKAIEAKRDAPSNLTEAEANRKIDQLEAEVRAFFLGHYLVWSGELSEMRDERCDGRTVPACVLTLTTLSDTTPF